MNASLDKATKKLSSQLLKSLGLAVRIAGDSLDKQRRIYAQPHFSRGDTQLSA
jgi:hypothetical protein